MYLKYLIPIICLIGSGCFLFKKKEEKIAIILTLSHPALEDAKKGFLEELSKKYKVMPKIEEFNAQGDLAQANQIAKAISQDKNIVGVFAIATLAAQSLSKAEKEKPIVIAAVSDVNAIPNEGQNVCGQSDLLDSDFLVKNLNIIEKPLNKIAIIYTQSEANSTFMTNNIKNALLKVNKQMEILGINSAQEIQATVLKGCQNNDALLIPLDNQLVASMPFVIKAANQMNCPVIALNESPIHQGALMAFGVDYFQSGKESAKIMHDILKNKKSPKDIGYSYIKNINIFKNKKIAKKLNINFLEGTK